MTVGSYNHYSDSLHLYNRDSLKIGVGEGIGIENTDSLALNKVESEKIFKEIYQRMKVLATKNVTEDVIYSLGQLDSEFISYNNIMLIIAAYVAQKGRKYDLAKELVEKCSNRLYVIMWERWKK